MSGMGRASLSLLRALLLIVFVTSLYFVCCGLATPDSWWGTLGLWAWPVFVISLAMMLRFGPGKR